MVIDFSGLYSMPRSIDRLFDELWSPLHISQRRLAYPPVNISESRDKLIIQAELPGVAMDDMELILTEGNLIIRGVRMVPKGHYLRQERPVGLFQRVVTLAERVDREGVSAKLRDGLLTIALPKAQEKRSRNIKISVGE